MHYVSNGSCFFLTSVTRSVSPTVFCSLSALVHPPKKTKTKTKTNTESKQTQQQAIRAANLHNNDSNKAWTPWSIYKMVCSYDVVFFFSFFLCDVFHPENGRKIGTNLTDQKGSTRPNTRWQS
jgi:hypothetical protein